MATDNKYLDKSGLQYFWGKLKTYYENSGIVAKAKHATTADSATNATNATNADKLGTPVNIGVGTAATGSVSFDGSKSVTIPINSVKEAYLEWGGKNFSGNYGPMDAALIPAFSANRFAFLNPAGVTIEYSRDGGSSWIDYGDDTQKKAIFGAGGKIIIGKPDAPGTVTNKYKVRVIIDTIDAKIYTQLIKFCIHSSDSGSNGGSMLLEGAKKSSPTVFETITEAPVSGWPMVSIINLQTPIITATGVDDTYAQGYYQKLRFTFSIQSHDDSQYEGFSIHKIEAFGGVGWVTPSNMAKLGTVYSVDNDQNVTFPGRLTAKSFGGLPTSSTSTAGIVALTSTIDNSETKAITPKGVKTVLDSLNTHKGVKSTNDTFGHIKSAKYHSAAATGITPGTDGAAVAINGFTTTTGRYYAVETDVNGLAFVNVPWTSYTEFKGATSGAEGASGLVKKPAIGDQAKFLKGDGTWASTPYPSVVGANGTTGLIKNGSSVTSASGYTPAPIIDGVPYYKDTNTTYSPATTSANGLMSSTDKAKLDGIAANANNYTHPTTAGNKHIPTGGSVGQYLKWSDVGTATWNAVTINDVSDLNASWDALLKVVPSAYVTRWPKVSEVTEKHNLTIKINSGSTEDKDLYTYNLTADKALNLKNGTGIVISGAVGGAITFTHSSANGFKHIPANGATNQVLVYSDVGTAAWGTIPSSTVSTMAGYSKQAEAAISTSDTLNQAIGKLETKVDKKSTVSGSVLILAH